MRNFNNFGDEAVELLISNWRNKPIFQSILLSYIETAQQTGEAVYNLIVQLFDIDTSAGQSLEIIGQIVGEARETDSDTIYRRRIRVKLKALQSTSTVEDLIGLAQAWAEITAANKNIRVRSSTNWAGTGIWIRLCIDTSSSNVDKINTLQALEGHRLIAPGVSAGARFVTQWPLCSDPGHTQTHALRFRKYAGSTKTWTTTTLGPGLNAGRLGATIDYIPLKQKFD